MTNKEILNSPIVNEEDFKDESISDEGAQCSYKGSWFNDGETTCINDRDHKCRNGKWVALETREYCG